jgi:hypothetical protein
MSAPRNDPPPLRLVPPEPQVILLPQNIEAEAGVLGSILIDNASIVLASPIITPDDFFRDGHRAIYAAMLDLFTRGIPSDLIILTDELSRSNRLEDCGGIAYIGELINQVPSSANVEHYARIVKRTAILRRLIQFAGKIAAVAYNEAEPSVALEQAQQFMTSALADSVAPMASRFAFASSSAVKEMPMPEWLIGNHLATNTLSLIFGEFGSAKSFLALDWALRVATGTPWLGHAVKQGHVAYIAGEGIGGMGKRIRAWEEYNGIVDDDHLWLLGDPPQLLDGGDVRLLIAALHQLPQSPSLVIIDTLAQSFAGGNENAQEDMGLAVRNAESIRREFGCHVMIVHHSPWDGKRPRGSTVLPGAVYTSIAVSKDENAVSIHCHKQKDFAQFADQALILHTLSLDEHADTTSCVLIPPDMTHSTIRPNRRKETPKSDLAVLDYLTNHGPGSFGDIVTALPFGRSTIHLALKSLMEIGHVVNQFGEYRLSESN